MVVKGVRYNTVTATGLTIRERHWEELDNVMDWLMDPNNKPSKWCPAEYSDDIGIAEEWRAYGEMQGRAHGIAYSLAMWENPLYTSIDEIRAAAVARWKERQADGQD